MSRPTSQLLWMIVGLLASGFVAGWLCDQIVLAFFHNPFLNTFILGVLAVGAIYLFWLAFQLWRDDGSAPAGELSARAGLFGLARQEFLVAAGNPKAILIFTAFLPQFVDPALPSGPQFAVLGALFLVLELVAMGVYAWMGVHMRRWFAEPRGKRLFNRSCAVLLAGAGAGLLAARR